MYIVLRSPYLKIAVVHVSIPVTIFNRDSLDLLTILKKTYTRKNILSLALLLHIIHLPCKKENVIYKCYTLKTLYCSNELRCRYKCDEIIQYQQNQSYIFQNRDVNKMFMSINK